MITCPSLLLRIDFGLLSSVGGSGLCHFFLPRILLSMLPATCSSISNFPTCLKIFVKNCINQSSFTSLSLSLPLSFSLSPPSVNHLNNALLILTFLKWQEIRLLDYSLVQIINLQAHTCYLLFYVNKYKIISQKNSSHFFYS